MIVAGTMVLGTGTYEVSAASKKPYKVTISSCKSYDYNAVKITWKQAKYAKKYQVYRAPSKYGKYKLIRTTTSRSYINKSLATGKKYYYKVRAVNGSKKGSFSYKKCATPALKKTYGVKTTANNYNSITVSWAKVNGAKGYVLYQSTCKDGTYTKVKSIADTEYKVSGLTTGNTYYYKVRAYRLVSGKYKYGAYSDVVSKATVLSAPKASAQLNKDNKIEITWSAVEGATGYKLYRSTSKTGSFSIKKNTTETSYVDGSAKVDTTYYYKVVALRDEYTSEASKTVSCKWTLDINAIRNQMLDAINKERGDVGLEPLKIYSPINYTAQEKAEDLYETGVFDHYSDNLGWFYDQWEKADITYSGGGENIACGQQDVTSVMKSWMQSKGHKANILNENWTHVGIGYYKGNWVQQFAMNPKGGYKLCVKTGIKVTCICGHVNTVEEWKMYSTDGSGNVYGFIYCESCNKLIEKCPCCEDGVFVEAGIATNCSKSYKCNVCGNQQKKTCITNCPSCNSSVVNNSFCWQYKVTFDSTQSYNGEKYEREEGCYFQQYMIDMIVCKDCNSIIVVEDYGCKDYLEFMENLKEVVGSEGDLFQYIYFEKHISSEKLCDTDKGTVFKRTYEFRETPRVYNLNDLVGTKEI